MFFIYSSIVIYHDRYPLHYAAQDGLSDIIELLLKHGARVNAATSEGYTSLHIAAENGHEDTVS